MNFNFLAGLEQERKNPVHKFQIFEATLGTDVVSVKIPLQNASLFEDEAAAHPPKSILLLKGLARKHGGSVL